MADQIKLEYGSHSALIKSVSGASSGLNISSAPLEGADKLDTLKAYIQEANAISGILSSYAALVRKDCAWIQQFVDGMKSADEGS